MVSKTQRHGKKDDCDYKGAARRIFVVKEQFCIFIMVVVIKIYSCVKIAQNFRTTGYPPAKE